MTTLAPTAGYQTQMEAPDTLWRRIWASGRVRWGGAVLLVIFCLCVLTLPWTMSRGSTLYYDGQLYPPREAAAGEFARWLGTDELGRSILARSLLGGTISLAVGIAAAAISVALGLTVGLIAGFKGGWVDSLLMRSVDVFYGLPYFLLVIMFKIAFERPLEILLGDATTANLVVLFLAIGLVSWLTMARVVRGQVLSLRGQPFIEAARALGLPPIRIFLRHILPNLIGPITVYATLIIPQAILQESFLSFLGVGVKVPVPTWGSMASTALPYATDPVKPLWWMLVPPCGLLVVTLLSLNFLGDGLRDVFDPKKEAAKL